MNEETAITVDDLRQKALQIRDMAEAEARDLARERGTQLVVAAAVTVIVLVSVAYYLGSRRR